MLLGGAGHSDALAPYFVPNQTNTRPIHTKARLHPKNAKLPRCVADLAGMIETILLTLLEASVYTLFIGSLVAPFIGVLISEWDR